MTWRQIVVEHLETVSDLQWKVEPACHVTPQGLVIAASASHHWPHFKKFTTIPWGRVAQSVARSAHTPEVAGSNPHLSKRVGDLPGAGASDDNTLHMQVSDSPSCYRWYLTPVNRYQPDRASDRPTAEGRREIRSAGGLGLRVMRNTPENLEGPGRTRNEPPGRTASYHTGRNTRIERNCGPAQLTKLSWRKKQHPEVRQLYSSHVQHVLSKGTAYNRNSSLWEIVVAVDSSVEQAVVVSGQPVLLDNCFVLILQYDLSTAVWSLPDSTMEYSSSAGNFTLVYLASALPEALVWDHTDVTYSFGNGTGTLQILEGNVTSNLIEAPLESIQEITAGPNGDFVIHLTSNKLYYGRVDKENVIELTPGELSEAEFVLYFDMLGRLHLVTYDRSAEMYDPTYKGERAESSKEVTYDLDNLGCPIDVFYSDKFQPTVDLYDGDQFVHEVKEDYFVWEAHGRTGYVYSATMQQAGCVCEAQTLSGMLTAGNVSSPDEAWGPQNYRPCSTPCDPTGSLTGQYEVLSSSGVSALMFGSSKGIFVFNLKVLDPECSYCVLQTQFAVRVYGSPRESLNLYVYISVLAFILGTVVILVLTYYRQHKNSPVGEENSLTGIPPSGIHLV
ncbi:hypothetical protein Bbelb_279160 [Branchiostoma belcheri]|nr:hypothetical protein Bbelb_279160 [Branchiostoma belcheri]